MIVFTKKPLEKLSWWQKLLKKQIEENLIIEINNLLASKNILEITPDDINRIIVRYGAVAFTKNQRRFLGYYHLYLQKCLEDKKLSEKEIAELAQLKVLLNLPDKVIKQTHQAVVSRLYGMELERTITDGNISDEEQHFLQNLSDNLLLSKEKTEKILEEQASKRVNNILSEIMSDERITPEEEETFNALVQNLGIRPDIKIQTRQNFERYKLYWSLENQPLPKVDAGIDLPEDESACFSSDGGWFESRSKSRQTDCSMISGCRGPAKDVSWRTGYPGEIEKDSDKWDLLDTGKAVLTNKRLIFIGQKSQKVIHLEKLSNFVPYNDGIRLEQERGESPILEIMRDADILVLLLKRVISER